VARQVLIRKWNELQLLAFNKDGIRIGGGRPFGPIEAA